MPRRSSLVPALLVAVTSMVAGCGDDDGLAPTPGVKGRAAVTVKVDNLEYEPAKVTVDAGETVAWEFADGSIPHNVKGDFALSPTLTKGRWAYTFDEPGRFAYLCTVHPYMKGTVTVR